MIQRLSTLAGLLAVWLSAPALVLAGPVEQMVGVAFGPEAEPSLVARYINGGSGLLHRKSGERSWQLQCDAAFVPRAERGTAAMLSLADGTLLVATQGGVLAGSLGGCDYRDETLAEAGEVVELVADPRDPNAAFALVLVPSEPSFHTTLQHRAASGQWQTFGVSDPHVIATGLRVAAHGGGVRVYQSALVSSRDDDAGPRYFTYNLRVSDDAGASYEHYVIPTTGEPRIIGVDPRNAEHLVLLIDELGAADQVLVSLDGGKTRMPYLTLGAYGGSAFAPDGRFWIGGSTEGDSKEQGIWAAASLESTPSHLARADYPVQCLGFHAASERLYACQHFWLGEVDASSGEFKRQLSFTEVQDFVGCEEPNTAARCEAQLCADYCGPAHFAAAPVCNAYDTPSCGRQVAQQESGSSRPNEPTPAPTTAPPMPTTSVPTPAADSGMPAEPKPAEPKPGDDDGSCSTTHPGHGSANAFGWTLAFTACIGWLRRRQSGRTAASRR